MRPRLLGTPWDRSRTDSPAQTYIVAERTLARLSDVETPTGIVAVAQRRIETAGALLAEPEPVLLLTGVADPGNAGSLLRSAEIFGIARILFGADGVEPHNPKLVRASMGAIFSAAYRGRGPGCSPVRSSRAGTSSSPPAGAARPSRSFLSPNGRCSPSAASGMGPHAGWRPRTRRSASHITAPARASTRPRRGRSSSMSLHAEPAIRRACQDPRNPDLSRLGDAVTLCYNPFVFRPEPPE